MGAPGWHPYVAAAAATVMIVSVACSGVPALGPSPPVNDPQPRPPSTATLHGRVFEHTGAAVVPLAGVPLVVTGAHRVHRYPVTVRRVTDADGGYSADVNRGIIYAVQVGHAGEYLLACLPFNLNAIEDQPFDLHVATAAVLSALGPLAAMPARPPMIEGMVFERGPQGVRPIAGALVERFVSESPEVHGATVTGPDGRYRMCAYGSWDYEGVQVTRPGFRTAITYPTSTGAGLPWDGSVELRRE